MKYALIGCGRIATNHIKAAVNNNLELVAVCDNVPQAMENLLERHDLHKNRSILRYTDYKEMLAKHHDLQLISIATESESHAKIALDCIEQGINLIIEKPIAMSIPDADKIIKRSREKGVKVSACHQNRFNIAVQKLKDAIETERFGRISHGSINIRWNRNASYYEQAQWRGKWGSDGGALMNQCIHGIDLIRWMLGNRVKEVYGVIKNQYHNYIEAEDLGTAILKFENGSIGIIEGTVNIYPKNLEETLYIFGEKGTVKLGGKSTNSIDIWEFSDIHNEDERMKGLFEETSNIYGNGHTSLFADVIDAVQKNRMPYVDAVDGRNALEIVLAIYKSQKTGKPEKLPLDEFASTDMIGEFLK